MMAPDLAFWTRLFGRLAVEAACVTGAALLAERLLRAAFWRRTLWQSAMVCLLLLTASELTGFGRGLASYFFGQTQPEHKLVFTKEPWESRLATVATAPQSAPPILPAAPLMMVKPVPPPAVWWPGLLWLAGGVVVGVRIVATQIMCISLRRRRVKITGNDLPGRVAGLLRRMGARRKICLVESPDLRSPISFGVLRPSIGLPADFAGRYSVAEQEAMLAHELAHLVSGDPVWYLLADAGSAALWWHPPTWWARRRLQQASELAADEAAAILPGGPVVLAECLVGLGKQLAQRAGASSIGIEGGFRSNLAERVQRLLGLAGTARQPTFGWKARAARGGMIVGVSAAALAVTGCLQNRDNVKQPTLRAELSQSWESSPASTLWNSAVVTRRAPAATTEFKQEVTEETEKTEKTAAMSLPPITPSNIARKTSEESSPSYSPLSPFPPVEQNRTDSASLGHPTQDKLLPHLDQLTQRKQESNQAPTLAPATALPVKNQIAVQEAPATNSVVVEDPRHPGRSVLLRKLRAIQVPELPEEFEKGLPLSEVLSVLHRLSVSNDLDGVGINFMFKPRGNSSPALVLDPAARPPPPVDPETIHIKINPMLKNLTLEQALDVMCQVADAPTGLTYAVEDYAVWFYIKPPDFPRYETRKFHVDATTFMQGLQGVAARVIAGTGGVSGGGANGGGGNVSGALASGTGVGSGMIQGAAIYASASATSLPYITRTNLASDDNVIVANYFGRMGINLTNNGSYVFFNRRAGDLLVRSTPDNLDTVERVVEMLNKVPPRVQLEIKFVALPRDGTNAMDSHWLQGNLTNTPVALGVLEGPQFHDVLQAMERTEDVDILSAPTATTESGRHVAVTELGVNSTNSAVAARPMNGVPPVMRPPGLEVVPTLSADGFTIRMVLTITLSKFVVNDSMETGIPEGYRFSPEPSEVNVWDGQTVVLGRRQTRSGGLPPRNLLIFVTPRIVDGDGKRIHTDEEMPLANPQPNGTGIQK